METTRTSVWPPPEAAILGLQPGETDLVRIILAAQLRLRQGRRGDARLGFGAASSDLRRIISARDALLRRAVGVIRFKRDRPAALPPRPRGITAP